MIEFDKDAWGFSEDSKLFVLTGAGVSAESGIQTFRDSNGLWENHSIEEVATAEGFAVNPELVIDFYNQRRKQNLQVDPNPAHIAFKEMQEQLKERMTLVTQNVDNLHERAGYEEILHMHGELCKLRCVNCMHVIDKTDSQNKEKDLCEKCGSELRPHIVWFGEIPFYMDEIEVELQKCTHFIFCGTSSKVYPAAGFKQIASSNGAKVLAINLEVDFHDPYTDFYIEGKAGEVLPKNVNAILGLSD